MRQFLSLTVLVLLVASGAWGQDTSGIKTGNLKGADLKLMKDHDPAVEQANFDLLPGYEVNLFAAEPMLANPIHMVWDSRGRLWVACSWAYPQLVPGEVANDKIIILEDTDDDGKADKSTVFAEGLYMPTGIELANGGCYVAQTPDVFFLKDTDGDDVADVKELALTGFGIEDSHHSISAWRRGPGGWLYFQEGIFLHSQIETQHGMVRNYNGGVYQFNPRTQELRMFARIGVGNPWGHVFDRWGQSFFIDNPRVSYLSPSTGNSGEKVALAKLIQTEKQCGGDLASGRHLPEDIRGQLLTCRFKSRTIIRYELLEDGAGFTANVLPPLIASKHPNFRPVDCKIGPDGAVYVADWYNSIINHAQHDFRDARRDHHHGRIWRITAKGRPLVKKPMLAGAPVTELLDHLKSPESWTRHQARLELSERNRDEVAKALEEWVANLSADDPNIDHHLVEAMWAGQNVERPSETILRRVLAAKDGHARAAGARMIRYWHAKLSDPVALIAKAAADPFPRARMEAVLSAGFIPKAEAFPAALRALDHPRDKFIEVALPQTVKALESYWRPALEAGILTFAKAEHGDYARRESGIGFDKRLAAFLRNQAPQESEIANIKAQLVAGANAKQVRMVADALTKRGGPRSRDVWIAMLEALEQVGRASEMSLGKKIAPLRTKLPSSDDAIASAVAATLGAWKVQEAGPALLAVLRDRKRTEIVRRAAAVALGALGGNDFAVELRTLAASGTSAERYLAVGGLVNLELKEAAAVAAKLLAQDPGDGDPVVLVMAFVQRAKGTGALVGTLRSVKLHPAVVKSLAEFHRKTGRLPSGIVRRLQGASSATLAARLLKEKRKVLITDVENLGDPARGEMIYRRKELACMSCHGIGSVGPEIGPNLAAVGAAATTAYMVESILEPNKSIAEHYENMMFTLSDNSVRVGVVTFKSDKEVVIRDSTQPGSEIRMPTVTIKKTQTMPSLMPAGLAGQLRSRQEFLDLAKFISVLGRPGRYANDERPVIRKWSLLPSAQPNPTLAGAPDDGEWAPAYSLVSGELPATDLAVGPAVFARGYLEVQVAGRVRILLNDTRGLRLWVDELAANNLAAPIQLERGRRTLTFLIDRSKREGAGLRVELAPASGSPAKFRPEGGN